MNGINIKLELAVGLLTAVYIIAGVKLLLFHE